jgi:hypothetical protein
MLQTVLEENEDFEQRWEQGELWQCTFAALRTDRLPRRFSASLRRFGRAFWFCRRGMQGKATVGDKRGRACSLVDLRSSAVQARLELEIHGLADSLEL